MVFFAGGGFDEAADEVGGGDVADLVLAVVADEHAGEFSLAEDGEGVGAGGALHGGFDEVGEEALAGEEVGGDVDAADGAGGDERDAVVLYLIDFEGLAEG